VHSAAPLTGLQAIHSSIRRGEIKLPDGELSLRQFIRRAAVVDERKVLRPGKLINSAVRHDSDQHGTR
jgi:hypothetical protein